MRPEQVGGKMKFLGMNKTHRDGYFGESPRIWGDAEWSLLLGYLSGGMAYSQEEWEALTWQPLVWNTIDVVKAKASPGLKRDIRYLKDRARNQDGYMKHMCSLEPFLACDALSTITESTAEGTEDDASEAAFEKAQKTIWTSAMRKRVPAIKMKASSSSKASPGADRGQVRKSARAPRQQGGRT